MKIVIIGQPAQDPPSAVSLCQPRRSSPPIHLTTTSSPAGSRHDGGSPRGDTLRPRLLPVLPRRHLPHHRRALSVRPPSRTHWTVSLSEFPVPIWLFLPPQSSRFLSYWFPRFRYGPKSQTERCSRKVSYSWSTTPLLISQPEFRHPALRCSAPCCFAYTIRLVFLGFFA